MKIEAGKTYRTRSGLKVRILETGLNSPHPIVGVLTYKDEREEICRFTEEGECILREADLVSEVSPYEDLKVGDPVIAEGYIRVFAGIGEGGFPTVFDDKWRGPILKETVEPFFPKVQEPWRKVLKDLLDYAWSKTCLHEETHRGGILWEICDQCGDCWADDRGGKPENRTPKAIQAAEELLKRS